MLLEYREELQDMLNMTGDGVDTIVGNLCEAITKYTRATETEEKVSTLIKMYILCLKAISEKIYEVDYKVREDGFTEGRTIMEFTLYPWGRINLLSLISRAKEEELLYKHNINHYLYAFMLNVEEEMYNLIRDDFIPICDALKAENKIQEKINTGNEVTSESELKELIDKIQSDGLRVDISPYKDPDTLENLKTIIITTEDGDFVKSRNMYTQDKREIKVLAQMYDEIKEERIARLNCYNKIEKIVRDELNYKAEMDMWRDKKYVSFEFKKRGETIAGGGYGRTVAGGVKVMISSGICGDRGAKEIDAIIDKIREELKRSHIKLYVGDDYDRF